MTLAPARQHDGIYFAEGATELPSPRFVSLFNEKGR